MTTAVGVSAGAGAAAGVGTGITAATGASAGVAVLAGAGSSIARAAGASAGVATVMSGAVHAQRYPGGVQAYSSVTLFPFVPPVGTQPPFQFQPTLDRQTYTAIVSWNVFGQRYYVSLYTLAGALVFCLPMIGSPANYNISLTKGYFADLLVFRQANSRFEVLSGPLA